MIDGGISLETLGRILITAGILVAMAAFAGGAFLAAQGKSQYRQIRNEEGKVVGLVDRTDEDVEPARAS